MRLIVLDTDVVSHHRAGRLPAGFTRQVAVNDLSIAFATAGELWKWALPRQWGGAQRRGRPRPVNDTWIAACCIEGGLPLLTLNRRDFADFAEHDGLVLLGA
jgi:predicted nucleic acid-binding protein